MTIKHQPSLRTPTENERGLAIALIAFAGALVGGSIAALISLVAKASSEAVTWGLALTVAAICFYVLSIFFGGRGIAYGPLHMGIRDNFNRQAVSGLIGILLMSAAIAILLLSQSGSALLDRIEQLEIRVKAIEAAKP